jgi:hypothetical protein
MARLRLLVVCTAAALIAAANLLAAEKKAAKSPAAKPRMKAAAETELDPFADAKQKVPAKRRPEPSIIGTPFHPGEAEAKIEAALNSRTFMDFTELPLQDAVDYLRESHKIEIQLDRRVLENVNIRPDTPVTINVRGISLKSALRLMLRNMQPELAYIVKDEVLLITTADMEGEQPTTVVYDVADLVVCRDEHDVLWEDYDALIDVITSAIQPTSWDGSPGSISGQTLGTAKVLVVSNTREIHQQIVELLTKIRNVAKKNPNAGIPRHDRLPRSSRNGNRTSLTSAGGTSGPPLVKMAPDPAAKPAAKPADTTSPPEQKPVEQKPTEPAPAQTPAQPKPSVGMPGGMPGTMPGGMR